MNNNTDRRTSVERAAPRTETERTLLALWSAILNRDDIDIYDDFIDLGGHSMAAMLCINRVKDAFAVELPLDVFFLDPAHIVEVASQIDAMRSGD